MAGSVSGDNNGVPKRGKQMPRLHSEADEVWVSGVLAAAPVRGAVPLGRHFQARLCQEMWLCSLQTQALRLQKVHVQVQV